MAIIGSKYTRRVILALIIIVIAIGIFFNYSSRSNYAEDEMIATLKQFRSYSTYDDVVKALGNPTKISNAITLATGSISQRMEWKTEQGVIRISFQAKSKGYPQHVTRITYVYNRGDVAYEYKLLRD